MFCVLVTFPWLYQRRYRTTVYSYLTYWVKITLTLSFYWFYTLEIINTVQVSLLFWESKVFLLKKHLCLRFKFLPICSDRRSIFNRDVPILFGLACRQQLWLLLLNKIIFLWKNRRFIRIFLLIFNCIIILCKRISGPRRKWRSDSIFLFKRKFQYLKASFYRIIILR